MSLVFFILALICMGGVVAALFTGLFTMADGRRKKLSNRMMQLRIWLQGGAILFLLLAYLAK